MIGKVIVGDLLLMDKKFQISLKSNRSGKQEISLSSYFYQKWFMSLFFAFI